MKSSKKSFFIGLVVGVLIVAIIGGGLVSALGYTYFRNNQEVVSDQKFEIAQLNESIRNMEEAYKDAEDDYNDRLAASKDLITEATEGYSFEEKVIDLLQYFDALYYEDYDKEKVYENMYDGMVEALGDKYAEYFTPEEVIEMMEDTSGTYEGIGAVVSYTDDQHYVQIVGPYEDSPADKAGILPNDIIMAVDGIDIMDMDLNDAVALIKGDKGTDVVLSIYRPDTDESMDITVTRDKITAETVSYELLDNNIGYLRLTGFQRVSPDQFKEGIEALNDMGQEGMIIDLRNNPGGLLTAVLDILDLLLDDGMVLYTEDKNGNREEYYTYHDADDFDKPLVVLVNQNSASASEILSGALKDRDAAEIVGVTTYGKGIVQNTFLLEDESAIKFTVERYFLPSGAYIHGVGIEPDVTVEVEGEIPYYIFDTEKEDDVQLQKAIQVMEGLLE